MDETLDCPTLNDLRSAVKDRLCARENLLTELFPLTERPLRRGDRVCGRQFTLHGPRNVRLSAVWTADRNLLYLYDTQGQRYEKVQVTGPVSE